MEKKYVYDAGFFGGNSLYFRPADQSLFYASNDGNFPFLILLLYAKEFRCIGNSGTHRSKKQLKQILNSPQHFFSLSLKLFSSA